MLQAKEVAIGRVWIVARGMDPDGSGRVPLRDLYEKITMGQRRWRQLLALGEGKYWQVSGGMLYLHSQARAAARLGIQRMRSGVVAVSLAKMAQSVKAAKAVLWNAVHSGRHATRPISRAVLAGLGVKDPRSQRELERLERVRVVQQYAIIGPDEAYSRQRAIEWGEPVFVVKDYKGVMGKRGRDCLARHLPNCYTGTLKPVTHGKKWFNRQLRKLHDQGPGATTRPQIEQVFFADGKRAGRAWEKNSEQDTYWPIARRGIERGWWGLRGEVKIED